MENLATPETQNATDFEKTLEEISSTDETVYECLNASNDKEAKQEFLENPDLIHPRNEYGNLNIDEVVHNLDTLRAVEQDLKQQWLTDKEQRFAEILIDDNWKKNEFLLANYAYNNAENAEDKMAAAREHKRTNEALYGKPIDTTFYALLAEKLAKIHPETPEEEAKYQDLLEKIGPLPETKAERFKPKPETVERFSEIIQDFYGGFLEHLPEGKETFTSEELAGIINEVLEEEVGDTTYRAIVDEKAANASANHDDRVIKFPVGKEYSRERAAALLVHELGTHTMRAIPYLEQGAPEVFSKGLPGNETFDEGVAKCVEQAIKGRYEDSGVDHYINIGLATFKGKNFREVYDIEMSLKELSGAKTTTVLNGVQRCFRGTGELPNNKDLAYYNGANQVWQYIESHLDDPELMDNLFLSGKANINDPGQAQAVYEMKTGGF